MWLPSLLPIFCPITFPIPRASDSMSPAPSQLTSISKSTIVFFIQLTLVRLACLISGNPTTSHLLLRSSHPHALPAYIFPLHRSSPNSSSISNTHRHLQRSDSSRRPNARMRLYDDLLLNGCVSDLLFIVFYAYVFVFQFGLRLLFIWVQRYYTTRLWMGTPPQRFALIVDTGSTVTYVPCSTCEQCGNHQVVFHVPEPFYCISRVICWFTC